MLRQATIPKTPEEVAVGLSQLTKTELFFVNGVIYGLNEARQNFYQSQERQDAQTAERAGA